MATIQTFGTAVRRRREALGLTQTEVALRLGGKAQHTYISRIERDLHIPRDHLLDRLAAALECSVANQLAPSIWIDLGPMSTRRHFGAVIRDHRLELGLNQAALAAQSRSCLSQERISRLERAWYRSCAGRT